MNESEPTDNRPLRLGQWLPYRLFIIAARVAELLADYYSRRYGLTQGGWRVLAVVGDKPGLSAREIRHASGLDQFAVSRAIGQLRELGYAERNPAGRDRRRAEVFLTAEGAKVLLDLSRIGLAIERELLAGVSAKHRAELDGLLSEIDKTSVGLVSRGLRTIVPDLDWGLPKKPE
jgi:DNA-binding MarR family transcriptional regulator